MRPLSWHPTSCLPIYVEHHDTQAHVCWASKSVQISYTSQSSCASKSILVSESLFFWFLKWATIIWAAVKINCWCLVRKYRLSLFGGALSLYSVLFKSKLNSAKMQQNWLHGFRSRNCWGWIKGALVVFAFATMLGSYLSTSNSFLGSVNVNNGNVTTGVFYWKSIVHIYESIVGCYAMRFGCLCVFSNLPCPQMARIG